LQTDASRCKFKAVKKEEFLHKEENISGIGIVVFRGG